MNDQSVNPLCDSSPDVIDEAEQDYQNFSSGCSTPVESRTDKSTLDISIPSQEVSSLWSTPKQHSRSCSPNAPLEPIEQLTTRKSTKDSVSSHIRQANLKIQQSSELNATSHHYNMTEAQLAVFRTTLCFNHQRKGCISSDKCPHSHCLTWQRRDPYVAHYVPRLCPEIEFVKRGNKMSLVRRCTRGRACQFAHSKEEELYHPLMYKTKLCTSVPNCKRHFCPFAHSNSEIRTPMNLSAIKALWGQFPNDKTTCGMPPFDSPPAPSLSPSHPPQPVDRPLQGAPPVYLPPPPHRKASHQSPIPPPPPPSYPLQTAAPGHCSPTFRSPLPQMFNWPGQEENAEQESLHFSKSDFLSSNIFRHAVQKPKPGNGICKHNTRSETIVNPYVCQKRFEVPGRPIPHTNPQPPGKLKPDKTDMSDNEALVKAIMMLMGPRMELGNCLEYNSPHTKISHSISPMKDALTEIRTRAVASLSTAYELTRDLNGDQHSVSYRKACETTGHPTNSFTETFRGQTSKPDPAEGASLTHRAQDAPLSLVNSCLSFQKHLGCTVLPRYEYHDCGVRTVSQAKQFQGHLSDGFIDHGLYPASRREKWDWRDRSISSYYGVPAMPTPWERSTKTNMAGNRECNVRNSHKIWTDHKYLGSSTQIAVPEFDEPEFTPDLSIKNAKAGWHELALDPNRARNESQIRSTSQISEGHIATSCNAPTPKTVLEGCTVQDIIQFIKKASTQNLADIEKQNKRDLDLSIDNSSIAARRERTALASCASAASQ